ncbi:MAG TPA: hypothetical protein VGO43_03395 [Pyrinomonadaceae bacterium]|jgi:hypothetical protein|nr:hypothetical protein [Pyrinomonadaceae bacterium]
MMKVAGVTFVLMLASVSWAQQQVRFGSEVDVERAVNVPKVFVSLLTPEDRWRLRECQKDATPYSSRQKNLLDHFVGSVVDVRNVKIMVVQGRTMCFQGAHNTQFWVLAKSRKASAGAYKKLFEIRGDGFQVDAKAGETYPDLYTFSHTAIEGFESTFGYSRGIYRQKSCYVFPLGEDPPTRRIRCSKYNSEFRH